MHFLKTKLCVGCTKGFEIVDLETLDMQGLLDPSDSSLDFVLKRDNVRPIAIYRIEEDFLLCYDGELAVVFCLNQLTKEFAFYVNKNGWRSRPKWAIIWEGVPTAFGEFSITNGERKLIDQLCNIPTSSLSSLHSSKCITSRRVIWCRSSRATTYRVYSQIHRRHG